MRRLAVPMLLGPVLLAPVFFAGCAAHKPVGDTLADLRNVRPDLQDATVEGGLDQAMQAYRRFLEETPETQMTPEAIRRLADLQLEKQFGIRAGDGKPRQLDAPLAADRPGAVQAEAAGVSTAASPAAAASQAASFAGAGPRESDQDFEKRASAVASMPAAGDAGAPLSETVPGVADPQGPLEAISLYEKLLKEYPEYQNSDKVLYQMARAYDELGRTDEAMATMERLIKANPHSEHLDEVEFRRGEYFFTRRHFRDAENAYTAVTALGPGSTFFELALYKLGWTFYKQELYEEALQKYMALLDYKVSIGYDFDERHEEEDEKRVDDTFRVISLGFSNLGGPDAVRSFFSEFGARTYEDRIYSNLGEHYLGKLRYDDAAKTFNAFVALYPFHRLAPKFSMRVVDTFTKGGFPKLVLEAKRDFASRYGLRSAYWQHYKPEETPDVLAYLKSNLKDLATHYHAQYQGAKEGEEKRADYKEAQRWYGDFLESFPTDADTPAINYRFADLLLEDKDFSGAAKQYERTAYEYPAHEKSADAGYAAVYAYREQLKVTDKDQQDAVKRDAVASSIRFADAFPQHEKVAAVLGAAADDMYEMKDYGPAVTTARRLIDSYPGAEPGILRSAWIVAAHGSFELADYPAAEKAYTQVLAATPEGDDSRAGFVDNLAASIYKQGEQANAAQDYRAAADHFLRIRTAAPTSKIRPTAEYDAGAALIRLQDWTAAAEVLEAFRTNYPKHELQLEATKQIALAYKESGQLSRAAGEYERLATHTDDQELRRESLLVAGDLYGQSNAPDHALEVYGRFVKEFPHPVEPALEARLKIADIHKAAHEDAQYRKDLQEMVRADADAGPERTGRTKTIGARSSLTLAEGLYGEFVTVKLVQPFEASLQEKKQRMDVVTDAMGKLVDYEIADVTSAATYYMAEVYSNFSRSLAESERPTDLKADEMQAYESALDEEAFPFEEKAIKFHEKNLEMLHGGAFNPWIEKSLGRLAELMPGRYAKKEMSSGFLEQVDSYVYRSPVSQAPPTPPAPPAGAPATTPGGAADGTQPPAPAPPGGSLVKHDGPR